MLNWSGEPPDDPWPMAKIHNISPSTFLLADGCDVYIESNPFVNDEDGNGREDSDNQGNTSPYNGAAPNRHSNGGNYLFKDGSVRRLTMQEWEEDGEPPYGGP